MSEDRSKELKLETMVHIRAYASVGIDPNIKCISSAKAIKQLLRKLHLRISYIDLFEINEAFTVKIVDEKGKLEFDIEKVNVNGKLFLY
ncbi:MAG: hypothetical protein PHI72_03510 [Atribacterota bacterium]|nr:hypothetical protein [Atribacterota bacterium]MDD4896398.1 hypothetical protein [Atribacterota bacterium]MDD5636768.1 hypothetical protein [Atribacterota bacterium]